MAWNQPGNNGQDNNPWGNNNNHRPNNNENSLLAKLLKLLNGNRNKMGGSSPLNYGMVAVIVLVVAIVLWAISGFYTIKEGERGVVTRFGKKLDTLVQPGLSWKPTFVDTVYPVNIATVKELESSGVMLTSDENVVQVEMNVQYQITGPQQYLFSVTNADDSLRQATDSALRAVIGNSTMDKILTEGRTVIRDDTKEELNRTIQPYNMGISVLDVNFQAARPPDAVRAAFDDAISAREDEQRFIREAEAYENEVLPRAKGKAARIVAVAKSYKERIILEAEGDVARFELLLPEYQASPDITRERMYLEMMEKVLSKTSKIITDQKNNNLMMLPLDQLFKNSGTQKTEENSPKIENEQPITIVPQSQNNSQQASSANDNVMQQRINNARRTNSR